MKKILLGTVAGLIWLFAFSMALCPVYNYNGIPVTFGCIIGGFILFSVGCTVALAATNKKEDKTNA